MRLVLNIPTRQFQCGNKMADVPDKWTAFWLSLVFPGAGQVAARSWSALAWLAAGMGLAMLLLAGLSTGSRASTGVRVLAFSALGLMSAEHAKRLLERRSSVGGGAHSLRRQVTCKTSGRSIDARIAIQISRPSEELWPAIADLPNFLVIDPFHDRVTLQRLPAAKGVDLVLSHNAFGRRFLRFGRIIAWKEGSGYTFSDLSGRNPRTGFPHVFRVAVRGEVIDGKPASILTIRVRGRWTLKLVPASVGRLWVMWVCREHARLLAKAL